MRKIILFLVLSLLFAAGCQAPAEEKEKPLAPITGSEEGETKPLAEQDQQSLIALVAERAGAEVAGQIRTVTITLDHGGIAVIFEAPATSADDRILQTAAMAKDIMPILFEVKGTRTVAVLNQQELPDDQGGKAVQTAVAIGLNKDTATTVDWDRINAENPAGIISVADSVKLHGSVFGGIANHDIRDAYEAYRSKPAE